MGYIVVKSTLQTMGQHCRNPETMARNARPNRHCRSSAGQLAMCLISMSSNSVAYGAPPALIPGDALHEKGLRRQKGDGPLVSRQEERALAAPLINRG